MGRYKEELIWILVPFIYGYLVNRFVLLLPLFLIQIIFAAFWFWVGTRFAKIEGNHWKNILVGNSLWLVSFLIFIWQFVLLDDGSRNFFFALLSQHYPVSFLWSGRELSLIFTDTINGTVIIIIAYLMMFVVFLVGYIREKRRG